MAGRNPNTKQEAIDDQTMRITVRRGRDWEAAGLAWGLEAGTWLLEPRPGVRSPRPVP